MLYYVEFTALRDDASLDADDCAGHVMKLTLRGTLAIDSAAEITLFIRTLIRGGVRNMMLNMEHLSYIDSSGIGSIIQMKKIISGFKGEAVLLNVPPKIAEVLELVNLKDYIKTFYSDEKAMEYFKSLP